MLGRNALRLVVLAAFVAGLAPLRSVQARTGSQADHSGAFSPAAAPAMPDGGTVGDGTGGSCTEAALTAALGGGGTVTFNCGGPKTILNNSLKTITQSTTIDGGSVISLSGNFSTTLFEVNPAITLVLKNIVLKEAFSDSSDGGAIKNHGNLTLENSTIQYSATDDTHSGGAIFSDGPLTITNSSLLGNQAGSGGALFANGSNAIVTIVNSLFRNNNAASTIFGYGGAIWIGQDAQLTFTDGELGSNTASRGGALYLSPNAYATLTASGSLLIAGNTSTVEGGAIYNEAGHLSVRHAELVGNQTVRNSSNIGDGGAIANLGQLTLADDSFHNNAGRFGGALFVGGGASDANANIQRTSFFSNTAAREGGGVFVSGRLVQTSAVTRATFDHVVIGDNWAGAYGGGLYANGSTTAITVTDSVIRHNVAITIGGGIGRTSAGLNVYRSSITDNTALMGGGLGNFGIVPASLPSFLGPSAVVRDTTISHNTATGGHGGGIWNSAGIDLINATIKDNTNGVFNSGAGVAMLLANSVLHNPGWLNCDGDGALPTSQTGNFSGDNSCQLAANGDEQGLGHDPMLGPLLTDSFGLTFYHLPLAGSPLINTATAPCAARDQRGAQRPNACDKGAVEYGGLLPWIYVPLVKR